MTAPAIQRRSLGPGLAAMRAAAADTARLGFASNPFRGIEYSPAYVAFFGYMVATITYRFPIGTASMVIALLTLPLEKKSLSLPAVASLSIALVLWAFAGMLSTPYPEIVVEAVSEFAKVCGVIFVAVNVINTRARFRAFLVGTIILWGLFPIRGTIFAYFFYGGSQDGRAAWNYMYSNPNDLASLALLQLAVALGIIAVERRKWVRLGAQIAAASLTLIIVLTQSRGAIIALVVFGMIGGRKYFTNVRGIFALIVLAGFIFAVAPDSVWKRFSTIKNATNTNIELLDPELYDLTTRADQSSSQQRLEIWAVARTIISEYPVTGVGLKAYPEAHYVTAQRPEFSWLARGKRDTHSTYLNVLAELGIVGFALFAAIIVMTVKASRSARRKMKERAPALSLQLFYLEVGLYGYLVAAIWGSYGFFIPMYVHMVLMNMGAKLLLEEGEVKPARRRKYFPPPAPVAIGESAGASA